MTLLAIMLVLVSALLHTIKSLFIKQSNDKQIFSWCYIGVFLLLFSPVLFYLLLKEGIPSGMGLLVIVISGVIHFLYVFFETKSYEKGDLSHMYPIMYSSPALVLLFSILFLYEKVSFLGIMGIIIVALGIYSINLKTLSFSSFFEPIRSITKERPVQYAFLTLLTVTTYSLIDKVGVTYVHPLIFTYLFMFCLFICLSPYIFITKQKSAIKKEWQDNKKTIILNSFVSIGGYAILLIALSFSKLSYVVGLRQISIVFTVLVGSYVLKEKKSSLRMFAALIIFIGAFLITIAS